MKNTLGSPARGDAFYQRDKEINHIYKTLETGTAIYLAAPRRVGKTSILRRLEEFPKSGFQFIYVITESIDNSNDFFKEIFDQLLKSDFIKRSTKLLELSKRILNGALDRVSEFNGVKTKEPKEPNYYDILIELFTSVTDEIDRVVIMIDEFPQTIQNILDKSGKPEAQRFLQMNREIRLNHQVLKRFTFIYTGSISLFPMVEKVASLTSVNDIRTVPVNPLTEKDAKEFITRLMEETPVYIDNTTIEYIIKKIKWLIPFHLQLIQYEIIELCDVEPAVTCDVVDQAFDQIVQNRNKPQFEPYFERLQKLFKGNIYLFVMDVLKYTASNDVITKAVLHNMSVKNNLEEVKSVLETLEGDGYLFKNEDVYQYTSPVLQLWCKKFIC
ncbi:MAG TPA: ATP-binding protein [Flavobacteriales bacterium]|nr:ATP-binding protein [Flavobacteriales bacterium]